jgi:hypothetical protein
MKKIVFLILIIIDILPTLYGQNVLVKSSFDTSRIYIGDQLKYQITVDQPSDIQLTLPFFKDTLCKNIEILSGPVVDSTNKDGRIKIIEQYLVTSFDSGFYQLKPVYAEMKSDNVMKRFFSDYSQLEVIRLNIAPADTATKIYDIIKPYRAPVTVGEMLPWFLIAALIAILVWFGIRFYKKWKMSKTGIIPVINPDPAHIIAFRELDRLKEEKLWQKGEVKHYYTRLTEILRQYLENRYQIYSLELTTYETLQELTKTGFKKDSSYNKLKTVLTGADLVKFAKYNPDATEHELHFKNSWDFIDTTKVNEIAVEDIDRNEKSGEGKI